MSVNIVLEDLIMLKNDVTAIIKAFNRPGALINLYSSIREFYPELKIIIVDDSKNDMDTSIFDKNVEYIRTEFDIGLSKGRNIAVSKVKTKYLVILDDDFLFTKKTKLEKMYNVLENDGLDMVSGIMYDFGKRKRHFAGKMEVIDRRLVISPNVTEGKHNGHKLYDVVLNFFMAKTDKVRDIGWDDRLKLGEHEKFFLQAKEKGLLITCLNDVKVEHYPIAVDDYEQYRNRVFEYIKIFLDEYGLDKISKRERVVVRIKRFVKKIPVVGDFLLKIKRQLKCLMGKV